MESVWSSFDVFMSKPCYPFLAAQSSSWYTDAMRKKIESLVILHSDAKRAYFPTTAAYETEKYAKRDAEAVAAYARHFATSVVVLPANKKTLNYLITHPPTLVMNLVDSIEGDDKRTPEICGVLDFLSIPYTGNGLSPILLCYDKFMVKKILDAHNIPTPRGVHIAPRAKLQTLDLTYPVISKLNTIHGSVGLTKDSISSDLHHLTKRIASLHTQYKTDILIEEYIEGTEVSAFVVEEGEKRAVYMSEDIFEHGKNPFAIASFEMRWQEENPIIESKKYINKRVENFVLQAFDALHMSGYSKFDMRVRDGVPYFIDINPNPAFGPPETDSPIAKTLQNLYGVTFETLLQSILNSALKKP